MQKQLTEKEERFVDADRTAPAGAGRAFHLEGELFGREARARFEEAVRKRNAAIVSRRTVINEGG